MKHRFPLEPAPKDELRLGKLTLFLIGVSSILVVRDCYQQTHKTVCECRGQHQSAGLHGPAEESSP